jgi:DNA-binding MarR family transcriptional regulator
LHLRPIHYRVLWWMIENGGLSGPLTRGWGKAASAQLGVHRITLNRSLKRLAAVGLVRNTSAKGAFELVRENF